MNLLLIEDEPHLAEALTASLKREQYTVTWSADGNEALLYALSGCYDLIILDIMLPGINGFDILREIRAKKIAVPVLVLTAKAELNDKIKGLDFGADDYLTKPFQTKELLARLRALSRRLSPAACSSLSFKDLELDAGLCILSCTASGRSMQLSGKEFELMQYLLQNTRQVLSRELLTSRIWGPDSDVEYNNVEVYISFLRKKLHFLGSDVQIKAIRGLGYTLK